jgi:hypothetical protein
VERAVDGDRYDPSSACGMCVGAIGFEPWLLR